MRTAIRFVFDFDNARPSGDVLSAADAAALNAAVEARDTEWAIKHEACEHLFEAATLSANLLEVEAERDRLRAALQRIAMERCQLPPAGTWCTNEHAGTWCDHQEARRALNPEPTT